MHGLAGDPANALPAGHRSTASLRRAAIPKRGQRADARQSANAGFTLIEVLVALVIMATMAGVLVISFPGLDQRRAEREAERLAGLLGLACEQAELSGRNIGLHLAAEGYGFSLADQADWLWFEGDHRFRTRTVEGLELATPGVGLPVRAEPGQPPHAQCWPAGELSALEVRFVHAGKVRARVRTGADALPVVEFSDDGRDWRAPR